MTNPMFTVSQYDSTMDRFDVVATTRATDAADAVRITLGHKRSPAPIAPGGNGFVVRGRYLVVASV